MQLVNAVVGAVTFGQGALALDFAGMQAEVTFLASLATGCTVSVKAGKYVFRDAHSNIVKELDADGMQTFRKLNARTSQK